MFPNVGRNFTGKKYFWKKQLGLFQHRSRIWSVTKWINLPSAILAPLTKLELKHNNYNPWLAKLNATKWLLWHSSLRFFFLLFPLFFFCFVLFFFLVFFGIPWVTKHLKTLTMIKIKQWETWLSYNILQYDTLQSNLYHFWHACPFGTTKCYGKTKLWNIPLSFLDTAQSTSGSQRKLKYSLTHTVVG